MRIIVVGAGKVGTALCRSLVEEKHDVILIEEKEEVLKRLSKRYDVMGFAGNGANFSKSWNKPRLTTAMSLSR